MEIGIVGWLKNELVKFRPGIKIVENEFHEDAAAAWGYIQKNGLHDAYLLATTLLQGEAAATPWGVLLAQLGAEALKMGKDLVDGEKALILAQAQADLVAAGKLLPPVAA